MPIPKPNTGEDNDTFIARCMADPIMTSEYPDASQRYAVCQSQTQKAYKPRGWATTDRYRGQYRKKYRSEMKIAMDKAVKPVFDNLEGANVSGIIATLDSLIREDPIRETYKQMYIEVGKAFASLEFRKAKALAGHEIEIKSPVSGRVVKDGEEEILDDIWTQQFADYVQKNLGQNIVSVTGDTRKLLKEYLTEILENNPELGTSAQTTALKDKLKQRYINDQRWRLNRIVRTETTTASNYGSIQGMEATGKDYDKIWLAAFSNTREHHLIAHNQTVNKKDSFTVWGEAMRYPGDPNGSAGNVVNCKCTQGFELKR